MVHHSASKHHLGYFFLFKACYANPRDEIKPNPPCGAMGCHWYWFHASINIKTMGPFRTAEWLDGFLQKHPKHVELSAPRQPRAARGFWGIFGGQILRIIHQISRWVFPKIGVPPNHPLKDRVFHYFHHPFWGKHPYFWKHPGGKHPVGGQFHLDHRSCRTARSKTGPSAVVCQSLADPILVAWQMQWRSCNLAGLDT